MADLLEFISAITVDKKRYCVVCFRSEDERKLVTPVALAEFTKLTRLEKLSKNEAACIYCERQAEVALKLYNTLTYARYVNKMLWSLVHKKMSPKGIAYLLPSKVRGQFAGPGSVKRNKLLPLLRRYQTLAQTDVLVVDATSINTAAERNSDGDVSIVIEDDDEQLSAVPRLVPIEKLLEKPPKKPNNPELNSIEAMSDMNPGSLVLYPVKTSNSAENQFLIIPDGANVQIDGNALKVVNDGPTIPVLLPNGNIVGIQPQNSNQIVLPITDNLIQNRSITIKNDLVSLNQLNTVEEIISDNRKIGEKITKSVIPINQKGNAKNSNMQYVPSNNAQLSKNSNAIQYIPNNNIVRNNGNTINFPIPTNIIPMGQKASEQVDNDQMCQITQLESNQICQISDLRSEAVSHGSDMCQISDLRSLQDEVVVETPPEPKKKADPNIDWEDKIPMDVISFMDANDPNAPNIIAPPPAPPAPPLPPAPRAEPTPTSPRILNHSVDLLMPYKPSRRPGRKRKCEDDLIVIN